MPPLNWLLAPSAENLSFAVRCCVSVALVLYLAFWLQLDSAYWAFINVAIMIRPLPGFVVVRGFSRIVGTLVAALVSVAFIALFAQSYVMFSAAMVAWVSLMVFCASLFQNNLQYGFVLAGYVAMIVGVRAMSDPSAVFSIAVARSEETALAVVVAAFVSVLLAPGMTARKYRKARTQALRAAGRQLRRLGSMARRVPDNPGDDRTPHPELHGLVETVLSLEQTRQYARYDEPRFAGYERLARRLDYELLAAVSGMASLQVYLSRLGSDVDRTPLERVEAAAYALEQEPDDTATVKRAFGRAYNTILQSVRADRSNDAQRSLADWVVVSRSLDLVNRTRAVVVKHALLLGERGTGGGRAARRSEFEAPVSLRESVRTTLRAAAAVSLGAVIWATHNDPALNGLMVLLAVLTTLFALGDDPVGGARGFGIGGLCAGVAAFVVNFLLLPAVNSYAMLMVVLMPFVFVAGLAMATPKLAIVGRISLVIFGLLVHPDNDTRQTFVGYAEALLGAELAVLLAVTAFMVILPVSPRGVLRERLAGMFGELAKGFTGSRERFETRVYSRLLKLPVAADRGEYHVSARQAAFAAVNMGLEARSLRVLTARARFDSGASRSVQELLEGLSHLFVNGYPGLDRVTAMQTRTHRLAHELLEQALTFSPRRRLRHGVRAAVAAELVAAALADYALARENTDPDDVRLGAASDAV